MPACFESKVVVVTGGSSGIGQAVAGRVAAEGGAVAIGARRRDAGEAVAEGIRASGGRALFVATDVTVEAEAAALVRAAVGEFGRLDGAFNNAGLAGVVGIGPMPSYVAAKHGVVGLTRSTALAYADRGVRVNAIVAGTIDTPLFRRLSGAPPEGELDPGNLNPARRIASSDEVAALVAYLLSDEAGFVDEPRPSPRLPPTSPIRRGSSRSAGGCVGSIVRKAGARRHGRAAAPYS